MEKKFVLKDYIAHILLLLAGAVILLGGCFQNSLWFDEAYTVGMMSHTLPEGMKWATFDVHPHLYYFLLKIFTMIFGNSLPVMRVFSAIGGILFVSLGLTHIRRDFGKSVGFWFSFCAIFSASTLFYAIEIRMYTWAVLFVTLAAIYAFRMYNGSKTKDRVLFVIISIASAYTHHFALFAVCAINLVLLYHTLKEKRPMKQWWQNAAVQIGCYIPGAVIFLTQALRGVASWITVKFPDVVFDFVSYHLLGDDLGGVMGYKSIPYYIFGCLFYLLYILAGVCLWKLTKSEGMPEKQKRALGAVVKVYYGVVIFSLHVSLVKPIYYIRYTVVISGLLFFLMALLISNLKGNGWKAVIVSALVVIFGIQSAGIYKNVYDPSANYVRECLDERIQSEDDILFEGIDGFVIGVQYPENNTYFYNSGHWKVHEAYRSFGENAYVLDEIEDYDFSDRVWTLGRGDCYKYLISQGYCEVENHKIFTVYHEYNFHLILLEKK